MTGGEARRRRTATIMRREGFDAIVCRLPQNVLMLTGYLPVLGNSFCIVATGQGERFDVRLVVPEDEQSLVPDDRFAEVLTFSEETLGRIGTTLPAVADPLSVLLGQLDPAARVGYEGDVAPVVAPYTQVGVPGPNTTALLQRLLPSARLADAGGVLSEMASVKTAGDLERIRISVDLASEGFAAARATISAGVTEGEVMAAAYSAMINRGYQLGAVQVVAHVHVMAGKNAAHAYRAFNLTSDYHIARGDTVLVQMEVGMDGYWAELTRTFFAGEVSEQWRRAHHTCQAAQDQGLAHIKEGARARDVDAAVRAVMEGAGFGQAFKHGTGHGVGFQAINHSALPKLHPVSDDVLEAGMVHNMEPAVYVEGKGGIRLNDNVAVREAGHELLSGQISRDLEWLVTPG